MKIKDKLFFCIILLHLIYFCKAFSAEKINVVNLASISSFCELHEMYERDSDSVYINNHYEAYPYYKDVIDSSLFLGKSCYEISCMVKKKYDVYLNTIIIKSIGEKLYFVGYSTSVYYRKTKLLDVSFCFDEDEYKVLQTEKILNQEYITDKKDINFINGLLKSIYKFKVYQSILVYDKKPKKP